MPALTCAANRFSVVQITVQYCCIFVDISRVFSNAHRVLSQCDTQLNAALLANAFIYNVSIYFLIFYSIVECPHRIERELDEHKTCFVLAFSFTCNVHRGCGKSNVSEEKLHYGPSLMQGDQLRKFLKYS